MGLRSLGQILFLGFYQYQMSTYLISTQNEHKPIFILMLSIYIFLNHFALSSKTKVSGVGQRTILIKLKRSLQMNCKIVLQTPSFLKGREVKDLDFLFVMPEVSHPEKRRPTSQDFIQRPLKYKAANTSSGSRRNISLKSAQDSKKTSTTAQ